MFNLFKKRNVYLDYASATPILPEALRAMRPYLRGVFANYSGIHADSVIVREKIKSVRQNIANIFSIKSTEIIFTSGATESNNLAILGFFGKLQEEGLRLQDLHAITSEAEHSSVLGCFKSLQKSGLKVDYLKILPSGQVDISSLKDLITDKTVFVSVMMVNNEVGSIMPIRKISQILIEKSKKLGFKKPIFHTDAVSAPLYLTVSPNDLGVDMLSLDSGKLCGPKGVGLLYKKNTLDISAIMFGGAQEKGLRPGTLNTPSLVGFAEALVVWDKKYKNSEKRRLAKLQSWFFGEIAKKYKNIKIVGDTKNRIANNINIFVPNIESEFAVIKLDVLGFSLSSQSACMLETASFSYVVQAMGEDTENGASIRISMGLHTTKRDLERLLDVIPRILQGGAF